MSSVEELVGLALPNIVEHSHLSRNYRPVSKINLETCVKCDVCYIACRDGGHQAIALDEKRLPHVDEEKCVGCAMCAGVCPVFECIQMAPR